MTAPHDVIVLGDYFYDLIFSGLEAFPALGQEKVSSDLVTTGGASYITVSALHRLGVHVGWRAHFGSDEYSRAIYRLAAEQGIDLSLARISASPYRRVTAALPLDGERAFVTYADPDPVDQQEFWLSALREASYRHIHLGGALDTDRLIHLADIIHRRGGTISMDCADVPLLYSDHAWRETISHLDIFMPNAREARLITRESSLETVIGHLLEWCKLIVIKDGSNGALLGVRADSHIIIQHVPGIHAGSCIDTTGAGDSFNAGFLYGWVIENAPPERCTLYGNICGGLSVTGEGGATAAPTREVLQAWVAKQS